MSIIVQVPVQIPGAGRGQGMSLIDDLHEVCENIRRGETDDWDVDMVTAAIRALEAQPSSAPETENGFGIGPLCEEHPSIPARCVYHACYH